MKFYGSDTDRFVDGSVNIIVFIFSLCFLTTLKLLFRRFRTQEKNGMKVVLFTKGSV
jgi:hypothetical protein